MDILAIIDQEVKEIFSETVLDTSAGVEVLEREVLELTRELGRKVLETCLSESANDASSVSVLCSACKGKLRRFRKRQRYVQTLCGVVGVSRWVYRCDACNVYDVPWDSRVGLKEGFTVSVAESMCRLSARLDFREASEELAHHGIKVSHRTLQQKAGAVEIVDYMHAKSHLYEVAKQAFGEKAYESIHSWGEATEPFLYAGDTETVVLRIRALSVGNAMLSEVLQREVGYFQKHSKRMQYQTFAEKGYHIGSGLIESACKHVVAQRCKQASMKWSQTGINAVLFWRCLLKSRAWDTFWDQQTQNAA